MRKLISFAHVSLDGFAAGPSGELNWVPLNAEVFDFVGELLSKYDTALYGRKTYELMQGYWPTAADKPNASKHDIEHSQWYKKAHKIVLSKTMAGQELPQTTIVSNNIRDEINKLKQTKGEDIIIFGSPGATHSLLREDLVDGFWLFVAPVVLGKGLPLFTELNDKVKFNLTGNKIFSKGPVVLQYTRTDGTV